MKEMYIVKYSAGSHDDFHTVNLFVTENKSTATRYVTKFNKILKKWSNYYKKYEDDYWIRDEYIEQHFDRWYCLKNINNCYWEKIEIR